MKTTAEMIAVMQAFERGEELELFMDGVWSKLHVHPSWNWTKYDYRVKPKPRERRVIWVNEYKDKFYSYATEDDARINAGSGTVRTAVKYVEEV